MDLSKIATMEKISIKDTVTINEAWIQEYIATNPGVLGLGDLYLRDKERIQPNAGRLDLLLQETDTDKRYEVEIQLGKTDESHIIRTIEYWDIERKRYPMYEHCAVIVAEDITSRFLNVIHLFNGHIPLVALQMNAYKIDDKIGITFTKIVDELQLGYDDEENEEVPATDRSYWEIKATKESVEIADDILGVIREFEPSFTLKYNKIYIGLAKSGIAFNFAILFAKKNFMRLEIKLPKTAEIDEVIDGNGIDALEYSTRTNRYKIRLTKKDIKEKRDVIRSLLEKSYAYFSE